MRARWQSASGALQDAAPAIREEVVRALGRFELLRNTYLVPPEALYRAVISDQDYADILDGRVDGVSGSGVSFGERIARRALPWFWPQVVEAALWAKATEETKFPPSAYLRDEPRRPLARLMDVTPLDWSILDLGCNSGADLNLLYRAGYRNLHGVDAGEGALALFAERYPETFAACDVQRDLFQHYLLTRPTGFVDVIHSHGATIELVHPSFPIVRELCRVARKEIHVCIVEEGHSYPRMWIRQFESHGFHLAYCERPTDLTTEHSLLHFARVAG